MKDQVRDGIASIVAESALQLGYTSVKKEQEKAVKGFVDGKDVFVRLATGSESLFATACCH